MDFVLVASGLALPLGAGDALVRGAAALSFKLEIPALIVSLTVVAFGTSAPELLTRCRRHWTMRRASRWATWLGPTSPTCCCCWNFRR
jgi:Ca2+/Na+ antiporter